MIERFFRLAQLFCFTIVVTMIALPVLLVLLYAFNAAERGMVWTGLSFKWVARILEDEASMLALRNSVFVASLVTLAAWVLAVPLAFAFERQRPLARAFTATALLATVLSPDLAVAIAQARTFQTVGVSPGIPAIVAGQLPFAMGYLSILVIAMARTRHLEPALAAAADLGASPWKNFLLVFVPMTRPGWLAGAAFVFALSFQDFIFAFHLGGAGSSTLAVRIYSMLRRGISPGINMLFLAILAVVVIGMTLFRWNERNMEEFA